MSDAEESAKVRKLALAMLLQVLYSIRSERLLIEQQVEHKLIEGIVGPELAKNL
jgi:hypothetical protein